MPSCIGGDEDCDDCVESSGRGDCFGDRGGPGLAGFIHIPLHPDTAEDVTEDKRTVFEGTDKAAGMSSFAASRENDDVVALRNDLIRRRDVSGILSFISDMR